MSHQSFSLIIDFEATGVDPKEARPLEIAVMAVDSHTMEPESGFSEVIYDTDYPEIPQKIHDLTGISMTELHHKGRKFADVMWQLDKFIGSINGPVDYVIAYNKEYDYNLLVAESERRNIKYPVQIMQWLCAMRDVKANYKHKCWKLSHLALDHGISVDPTNLHRAMSDVSLTQRMLQHIKCSAHDMFNYNQVPWVVLQALIPEPWKDGGKGVELAKARGYGWETVKGSEKKVAKSWVKQIKMTDLEEERDYSPFQFREIQC